MTKADFKLDELPDSFAADTKWCNFIKNRDIDLGLFSWTEEDENDDGFFQENYNIVCFEDCLACIDEWGIPQWFKISTDEFLDALEELDDDQDCKIIYCLWHDGSRQDEYWLKPVACNDTWVYFDLNDRNSVIQRIF